MALDEPTEEDDVQHEEQFRFIMNRTLREQVGSISVDYLKGPFRKGFHIQPDTPSTCSSGTCSC